MVPSTVLTDRLRMHGGSTSPPDGVRWAAYPTAIRRTLEILQALAPEGRDAFLYWCSALFAGIAALAMGIPLYRQWGQMAVGPYAAAAVLMTVVAVRRQGKGGIEDIITMAVQRNRTARMPFGISSSFQRKDGAQASG